MLCFLFSDFLISYDWLTLIPFIYVSFNLSLKLFYQKSNELFTVILLLKGEWSLEVGWIWSQLSWKMLTDVLLIVLVNKASSFDDKSMLLK